MVQRTIVPRYNVKTRETWISQTLVNANLG